MPTVEFTEQFTREHFIEVLEALHQDQTGLAQALVRVKQLANGWAWATESRGCYEWDDDRFYKEFGACLDAIITECDKSLMATSQAHRICCGEYGHVHRLSNEPVQIEFPFGQNYEDFVQKLINFSTIEGRM